MFIFHKIIGICVIIVFVLLDDVVFATNLVNSHKYVIESYKHDGPLECFVTTFTYTWLASVKAFGAGIVWPLTAYDFVQRYNNDRDSLNLWISPEKEVFFKNIFKIVFGIRIFIL